MGDVSGADTADFLSTQDLISKYFGPSPVPVQVEFGALSHSGRVRSNNEDHYSIVRQSRSRQVLSTNLAAGFLPSHSSDDAYVLSVADGIGGAAFGELASMLALRAGWDLTTSAFKWHFKASDHEIEELSEMLQLYGKLIHGKLLERAESDPRLAGMGTTLTSAITIGLDAVIAHVGDSRAYLVRGGSLTRLTRDHTMAQQMVDAGVIPDIAHASRVMRHMLVNCLGGCTTEVDVDVRHVELADGDRLLLCTDGLTDMVEEDEITRTLGLHTSPDAACRALVDCALDHGGKDNVTVVLVAYATA
jgi:serine/threonine protein phosphatase PrpC